jgi:glycosyltransferase involved in cell wall biosynthesis
MEHTRILLIGHTPFSEESGTGITYISLFKNIHKENLAQIFFSEIERPDFSFCNNFFRISEMDLLKSILSLDIVKPGKIISKNFEKRKKEKQSWKKKILKYLKEQAGNLAFFRDLLWVFKNWKTKELEEWIETFAPQLLFLHIGGNGYAHEVSYWISKKYKIPYAVFFTDDFIMNEYHENIFQNLYYRRICKLYDRTIGHASKRFVIGELMAEDYSKRYNKKFIPIMNCIEFSNISVLRKREINNQKIIFSYIGGLHLNRWKSLIFLSELLSELEKELTISCTLNVYSLQRPDQSILSLLDRHPINYIGSLDRSGVWDTINDSDFLIHVESIEAKYRAFTKYSISTKIPEYLSSNRCIVAYGPKEVASIDLFLKNDIGLVLVDSDTRDEIKEKLKRVLLNTEYRNTLCDNAFKYAKEKFDAGKIRGLLMNELNEIRELE